MELPTRQELSEQTAVVDGSNVALANGIPQVSRLNAMHLALRRARFKNVSIVCDATLRHAFRERNPEEYEEFEAGIRSGLWDQAPARIRADRVILERLMADSRAVVVSNDAFRKEEDRNYKAQDLDSRHIRFFFYPDRLQLLYPEGWHEQPTFAPTEPSPPHDHIAVLRGSDGAILNAADLLAEAVAHQRVRCPACEKFVFKMWPEGWDGHSGWKCTGITASGIEERKLEFRTRFGHLFRKNLTLSQH